MSRQLIVPFTVTSDTYIGHQCYLCVQFLQNEKVIETLTLIRLSPPSEGVEVADGAWTGIASDVTNPYGVRGKDDESHEQTVARLLQNLADNAADPSIKCNCTIKANFSVADELQLPDYLGTSRAVECRSCALNDDCTLDLEVHQYGGAKSTPARIRLHGCNKAQALATLMRHSHAIATSASLVTRERDFSAKAKTDLEALLDKENKQKDRDRADLLENFCRLLNAKKAKINELLKRIHEGVPAGEDGEDVDLEEEEVETGSVTSGEEESKSDDEGSASQPDEKPQTKKAKAAKEEPREATQLPVVPSVKPAAAPVAKHEPMSMEAFVGDGDEIYNVDMYSQTITATQNISAKSEPQEQDALFGGGFVPNQLPPTKTTARGGKRKDKGGSASTMNGATTHPQSNGSGADNRLRGGAPQEGKEKLAGKTEDRTSTSSSTLNGVSHHQNGSGAYQNGGSSNKQQAVTAKSEPLIRKNYNVMDDDSD